MLSELKPCPYCGFSPHLVNEHKTGLSCSNPDCGNISEMDETEWNTRAPEREIGKEQTVVTWIKTRDRMPQPHHSVIVEGGLATWTGSAWLSKTGDDAGRVLQWQPLYWTPLIMPPLSDIEGGS